MQLLDRVLRRLGFRQSQDPLLAARPYGLTVLVAGGRGITPYLWQQVCWKITERKGTIVTAAPGLLIVVFGLEGKARQEDLVEAALSLRDELRERHSRRVTIVIDRGIIRVQPLGEGGGIKIAGEPLDTALRILRRKKWRGGGIFLTGEVDLVSSVLFEFKGLPSRKPPTPPEPRREAAAPLPMLQRELDGSRAARTQPREVLDRRSLSDIERMRPFPGPERSYDQPPERSGVGSGGPTTYVPPGREAPEPARPPIRPDVREEIERGPSADSTQSSAAGDAVICTVFAPRAVVRGDTFLVQVFAHLGDAAGEAAALATEFDASATRRVFRSLEAAIRRGRQLAFELRMPGCRIDDPIARLVWSGSTEAVQFGVTVLPDWQQEAVIGTVTVSADAVPVGHLKFKLEVVSQAAASRLSGKERRAARRAREPVGDAARRYSTAFISYASQDRDKVLARVQMLRPFGIRYFQDVLDLEPGARWEHEVYRHIDESDLFLLFWSRAAAESTWVLKEVAYALARKGDDEFGPPEIVPVILEGPPVPPPPPELAHLHFNDRLIYFMSGQSS